MWGLHCGKIQNRLSYKLRLCRSTCCTNSGCVVVLVVVGVDAAVRRRRGERGVDIGTSGVESRSSMVLL